MNNDVKLVLGQTVILKLSGENECFVGDLHFVRPDRDRIDLTNVRYYQTNEPIDGIQRFYSREIESIVVLAARPPCPTNDESIVSSSSNGSLKTASSAPAAAENNNKYQMSANELDAIMVAIESTKYFIHPDRQFHEAIALIRGQSEIALHIEMQKTGAISLMTISVVSAAAPAQLIYIFDILAFGGYVPAELKHILEAKRPRKIVHNSIETTLRLKRFHSIRLQSIADTLVTVIEIKNSKIKSQLLFANR